MPEKKQPDAITAISVKGFKSFADETRLEIRPLTLLAGANSSGKSSAMQPLLLLKQTLEASYDPGPLLLHDSHVRFTSATQLLHKEPGKHPANEFRIGLETRDGARFWDVFRKRSNELFELAEMRIAGSWEIDESGGFGEPTNLELNAVLRPEMSWEEISSALHLEPDDGLELRRDRCFLLPVSRLGDEYASLFLWSLAQPTNTIARLLRRVIHVPGLRGNPARAYRTTAVGRSFIGTFENYAASVIAEWQSRKDSRLDLMAQSMEKLGLSWKVRAKTIDATQVELVVGRLPKSKRGGASDLVNVADVGFGVSQTIPVLVALLIAEPGQLVYLEQPEIHLHPRAQEALADVLTEAANRGVQVVAETHSSILLLAVQALVAEGKLDPDKVKLHWFQRGDDGVTKVTSADLDPQGAYGDWPEDFGEVRAQAENRYLDAVEAKVFPPKKPKRNAKSR